MKKILVSAIFIVLSFGNTFAGNMSVPKSFLNESESNDVNLEDKKTKDFGKYVDSIFSYQEKALDNANLESHSESFVGGWKVSGYKTDLAISKSGIFGVGALKATAATELAWARRANKQSLTQSEESNLESAPYVVSLNQEMSEEEIREEIEPVISMMVNSGRVKKEKKLRNNLFKKTKEVHSLMRDIFNNGEYHWEIEKFRLNLSVGVSGNLFYYARVGGDFRVRLEWYKVAKKASSFAPQKSKKSKRKKLNKLVNKLIKEVSLAAESYESTMPNFKVEKVSIGIGASKKGVWGIAKSKISSSGFLFFKKVKNAPSGFLSRESIANSDNTELFLIDNNDDKESFVGGIGKVFKVPAKKFRKGLKKAFKISKWLSKKASRRTGKWYVKKFKVVFALSYKGIFGLSTTSGSATAEIYLKQ